MVQESVKLTEVGTVQRVLVLEPGDWPGLEEGEGLPRKLGIVMSITPAYKEGGVWKRKATTEWAPGPGQAPQGTN